MFVGPPLFLAHAFWLDKLPSQTPIVLVNSLFLANNIWIFADQLAISVGSITIGCFYPPLAGQMSISVGSTKVRCKKFQEAIQCYEAPPDARIYDGVWVLAGGFKYRANMLTENVEKCGGFKYMCHFDSFCIKCSIPLI